MEVTIETVKQSDFVSCGGFKITVMAGAERG